METYQIEEVDVGNSAHPLVLHEGDDDKSVADDGQQKDGDVHRYDQLTDAGGRGGNVGLQYWSRSGRVQPGQRHVHLIRVGVPLAHP